MSALRVRAACQPLHALDLLLDCITVRYDDSETVCLVCAHWLCGVRYRMYGTVVDDIWLDE
jgi:hypothetical protein